MTLPETYYNTLAVRRDATPAEIRTAYRVLIRRHHPDVAPQGDAMLRAVLEAYQVLSDPNRRQRYDQQLAAREHRAPAVYPPSQGGPVTERSRMMEVAIVPEPPSFNQLGILVLDGSGSMLDPAEGRVTKAQAVNGVVRNMLRRFKRSRHQRNFSFAVVTFDHNARLHTTVTPAPDIDDSQDYDPTNQHGGGTWMGSGLREAHRIAMNFLAMVPQDRPASVVIVLMSDGRDGEGGAGSSSETLRVAEEIKGNPQITICTTFFGGPGSTSADAEAHLRALASQPAGYQTSHDAEELRKFFIASFTSGTNVVMQ